MKSRLAIVFTIFLLFSMDAFGQAEAGSISGTVRDSSGAVLVGATVSARNLATSAVRTAQTGNLGQYTIPGLTPRTYDVICDVPNPCRSRGRGHIHRGCPALT